MTGLSPREGSRVSSVSSPFVSSPSWIPLTLTYRQCSLTISSSSSCRKLTFAINLSLFEPCWLLVSWAGQIYIDYVEKKVSKQGFSLSVGHQHGKALKLYERSLQTNDLQFLSCLPSGGEEGRSIGFLRSTWANPGTNEAEFYAKVKNSIWKWLTVQKKWLSSGNQTIPKLFLSCFLSAGHSWGWGGLDPHPTGQHQIPLVWRWAHGAF